MLTTVMIGIRPTEGLVTLQNKRPIIGILGSFSGNNAGDSALLETTMATILSEVPTAQFLVPSSQPAFIRAHFEAYPVKPYPIRVRYGSAKFWGLPAFFPFLYCHALVTTGGLLFDQRLFDPFFNVLIPWSVQLPLAHRLGKPIVGFNIGVGPLRTKTGERLALRVLRSMDRIVLRETTALDRLDGWGLTPKVVVGADTALTLEPTTGDALEAELTAMGYSPQDVLIGVNINSLTRMMTEPGEEATTDVAGFVRELAAGLDAFLDRVPARVIGLVTNELDRQVMSELCQRLRQGDVRLTRPGIHHKLLAGLAARCAMVLGMRLHALIFAASAKVPVIALNYSPKVAALLTRLELQDWILKLNEVNDRAVGTKLLAAWEVRRELQALIGIKLTPQRKAAYQAARELRLLLEKRGFHG